MIIFNENEKNHILLGLAVTFAGHLPGSCITENCPNLSGLAKAESTVSP